MAEFTKHGAGAVIQELIDTGHIVVSESSESEKELARQISEEFATHPLTKDKATQNHYPEAETKGAKYGFVKVAPLVKCP